MSCMISGSLIRLLLKSRMRKTPVAALTAWIWSPDAEPMDLRHYDNVAHDLNASYEDVQEGMSTPYGIARTTTFTLIPQGGYSGKKAFAEQAKQFAGPGSADACT